MSKTIFVSNRLPVTAMKNESGLDYKESIGGLATGLKNYHQQGDTIWAGWSGVAQDDINEEEQASIAATLKDTYKCLDVPLTAEDIEMYYHGFCNETIWPLFHYFTSAVEYKTETWEAYRRVNRKFFDAVDPLIEEGDTIWIHDYQLMLLPQMIRDKHPDVKIGFFLHIPFPSFEIYRQMIWREEILQGLMGANLIGFHTYDYVRHFLSSVRRLLGHEHSLYKMQLESHVVQVDAFPMGIDYDYFAKTPTPAKVTQEALDFVDTTRDVRNIVSVDRLDYTKGIPDRIKAFKHFLAKYPEYHEKVRLNLIIAPSRVGIEKYDELKREIEVLVSEVNGEFGTFNWMPVWFFFRTVSQDDLIVFYRHSDVLLVTPLRDGMNLVAKEYIASRNDYKGMLVMSETAGAASELGEAVIVNTNDHEAIADGIKLALEMPEDEKVERNKSMHRRLSRYNVNFWAKEFLNTLQGSPDERIHTEPLNRLTSGASEFERSYRDAQSRVLFLDYDGTLVGFKPTPEQARPDAELKQLLAKLASDPKNTVVIITGRDRYIAEKWLGDLNVYIVASHGLWLRTPGDEWLMTINIDGDWKDSIRPIMETYTDRTPGSLIEEKDFSLAWHYRQSEPDIAGVKRNELREALMSITQSMTVGVLDGNKVIEVKDSRVNKGHGAHQVLSRGKYDFVFGVGDDRTDEDMFNALPEGSYSVKIGKEPTAAKFRLKSSRDVRALLKRFTEASEETSAKPGESS
ncbi:bifunctional alpha,alpha-trehalose-phosphate synthase (UDP-forming)/trehalose-phosphatase [Saccharibacillus sp. CPCC 101409]|uniref:bifunctional alpha,alpha-trehalose-phosphate synthase (UDP-forming)/trehalose-phosphatase n=1 Tax=Saccharibacillus sp. CPCC 101409 TaxID=3058041 RepID=UPI002672A5EF|nr:bifunctional alpha,alpha-trehalose-phosphate synthase (UDP-forming)/trehalose-phosphatase [Saccharibacillus sp. CPCC 101409]MDO3410484.1 bifunctional alpha,alpha-trehalose-phosphate synthase (UDP-forming)/trehalose-phosphatase [Saccharibacillus sp. CPCC 101409]